MRQRRRPGTVVVDSEAVDALADPQHPKHRDTLAYIEVTNERRARNERVRVILGSSMCDIGEDTRQPATDYRVGCKASRTVWSRVRMSNGLRRNCAPSASTPSLVIASGL